MDITSLKHILDDYFLHLKAENDFVIVNGEKTFEIVNFRYELEFDKKFMLKSIEASSTEDREERAKILNSMHNQIYLFKEDLFTRQFVIRENYDNNKYLASCISLIHCLIRNDAIKMFIYVRSQNYEKNFYYDNQSYMLFANEINRLLKNKFTINQIDVRVGSLHVKSRN